MTRRVHISEKLWAKKSGRKLSVSARIAARKSQAVKVVAGKRVPK